jgi:hypothetical protein
MSDQSLRDHIIYLLEGGGAHLRFEQAFADLPANLRGSKPDRLPYTPWRLLEHLRICQWDILEFSRNPGHKSPSWPEGYWPIGDAPPGEDDWDRSLETFRGELHEMVDLVRSPATDLCAAIPWGDGQTILREALLLADHNSYHLGQMVVLRTLLGSEPNE